MERHACQVRLVGSDHNTSGASRPAIQQASSLRIFVLYVWIERQKKINRTTMTSLETQRGQVIFGTAQPAGTVLRLARVPARLLSLSSSPLIVSLCFCGASPRLVSIRFASSRFSCSRFYIMDCTVPALAGQFQLLPSNSMYYL